MNNTTKLQQIKVSEWLTPEIGLFHQHLPSQGDAAIKYAKNFLVNQTKDWPRARVENCWAILIMAKRIYKEWNETKITKKCKKAIAIKKKLERDVKEWELEDIIMGWWTWFILGDYEIAKKLVMDFESIKPVTLKEATLKEFALLMHEAMIERGYAPDAEVL